MTRPRPIRDWLTDACHTLGRTATRNAAAAREAVDRDRRMLDEVRALGAAQGVAQHIDNVLCRVLDEDLAGVCEYLRDRGDDPRLILWETASVLRRIADDLESRALED